MTNEQRELLKAMHVIKDYCESCENCNTCCLTGDGGRSGCPFDDIPSRNWKLKPLEEEKNFCVFYKNT